jgi:uncharacterized membrane protein YkvA (DUF1232 family)
MTRLREWADRLVAEVATLWFCARHPRTPLVAKAIAVAVVAYAFSPIDFIPDFIPVIGLLDDLLLLPIGVWIVLKLVPEDVMMECRGQAAHWLKERKNLTPPGGAMAIVAALIVAFWLALAWLAWSWLAH